MSEKENLYKKNATLDKLALQCGLSRSTVYRALAHPEKVRSATRERVYQAIAALNDTAFDGASILRKNRPCIGLTVGSITEATFIYCVSAIQEHAAEHNIDVYLNVSSFITEKEISFIKKMQEYNALCVICIGVSGEFDQSIQNQLPDLTTPLMVLCDTSELKYVDHISVDNAEGVRSSIQYCVDNGHTRIGFILGWRLRAHRAAVRLEAYKKSLEHFSLELDNDLIRIIGEINPYSNMDAGMGEMAMQSFLRNSNLPTAVLVPTGILSIGAIGAIKEAGLRVPEDISIISMGDDNACRYMCPTISAVSSNVEELLFMLMQYLNSMQIGNHDRGMYKYKLQPKLHLRESSGPVSSSASFKPDQR